MKIRLRRKQLFMLIGLAIVLLAIPLSVYLSQTNQNIRSEAAAGGKGKGKPTTTKATLSVSPSTVYAGGSQYTVTGSGFYPNQTVALSVADPGCCLAFNVSSDSSGNISFVRSSGAAGIYNINAYQLSDNKYVLMATTSFPVIEP